MRVLVVHNHYRTDAPSGERSVVEQESAGLRGLGHDVELFERFNDDIGEGGPLRNLGVAAGSLWGISSQRSLRDHLERFRPDVVHVHNLFPLISPTALRTCSRAGVPVVATIHNYKLLCARGDFFRGDSPCFGCAEGNPSAALKFGCYHDSRAQTASVVAGMVVHRSTWRRQVSAYIFISEAQRRRMEALQLPPERTFVKLNFVPGGLTPASAIDDQITYVGRLEHAKGIQVVMAAWEQFRRTAPDSTLRLAVVGGGPLGGEVAAWASTQPSVDFYGLLTRDEAMGILARSRCAIIPSVWYETFGLVAAEAMALGVAPVAAGRGSFPEFVEHGRSGVLFDPTDAGALARILEDADRFPNRFRELGVRARRAYLDRFGPERNIGELLEIYRFAIAHPAGMDVHAASRPKVRRLPGTVPRSPASPPR